MIRLIMLVLFIAAILAFVTAVIGTAKAIAGLAAQQPGDAPMPSTFKRIAYGLLVILLLGLATGLLGAA